MSLFSVLLKICHGLLLQSFPGNKYYIFGKDGGKKLAEKMEVPLLGQIPLVQSICEGSDNGQPVAT